MAFGSFAIGGSSSSSSSSSFSSLSASAPPFTLDRSSPLSNPVSTPFLDSSFDFNSSLRNSLPYRPTPSQSHLDSFSTTASIFDSRPSPNAAQNIISSSTHLPPLTTPVVFPSADTLKTSVIKAKPYYPSNASSSTPKDASLGFLDPSASEWLPSSYAAPYISSFEEYPQRSLPSDSISNWDTLWDGLAELNPGNLLELTDTQSREGSKLSEAYVSKDFKTREESSHSFDILSSNCSILPNRKQIDFQSVLAQNKSTSSTPLVPEESVPGVLFSGLYKNSLKSQSPHCVSVEKNSRQHSGSDQTTSTEKFAPAVLVRQTIDTATYSDGKFCSSGSYNICNDIGKVNFGGNVLSNSKDTLMVRSDSSEDKVLKDSTLLNIHVKGNEPTVSKSMPSKDERKRGVTGVDLNQIAKADSGIQIAPLSSSLCLPVNINETPIALDNYSEGVDQYNSAVDSPCWKGSRITYVSPFEPSDIVESKCLEVCDRLNLQVPGIHPVRSEDIIELFTQRLSDNNLDWDLQKELTPPKIQSVAHSILEEHKIDDISKVGSYSNVVCDYGVQYSNDGFVPLESNSRAHPSYNLQQTEETNISYGERNICASDFSEDCSYQVAFDATEHVLRSPSCPEDVPMKLSKTCFEELTPKLDLKILIDTMYNQSELLLVHCSNGLGDLQEKDLQSLKKVIHNLKRCIGKSVNHTGHSQIPFSLPQKGGYLSQSSEVGQTPITDAAATDLGQVNDLLLLRKDETIVNFVSTTNDANSVKEDKMAMDLKKVLNENFYDGESPHPQAILYKNLWLEAEAALYTMTFKARFNHVKMEMEKCKSQKMKECGVYQSDPNPKTSGEFHLSSASRHADDVMDRAQLLNRRMQDPESVNEANTWNSSSLSLGTNNVAAKKPAPDVNNKYFWSYNSNVGADKFIEAYVAASFPSQSTNTTTHSDDVMAKFQILKCRDENSNPASIGAVSRSRPYHYENKTEDFTLRENASLNTDVSLKDSSNLGEVQIADDVDSLVMARFHIIKNRGDNFGSTDVEQVRQPAVLDQVLMSQRHDWPNRRNKTESNKREVKRDYVLTQQAANQSAETLAKKETTRKGGNRFYAGYDNSSSDWEHIMKEEVEGENN